MSTENIINIDVFSLIVLAGTALIYLYSNTEETEINNPTIYEGGEEEKENERNIDEENINNSNTNPRVGFTRNALFRLIGNWLPSYRLWFGHATLFFLDPQNYESNRARFDAIASNIEWFNELLDLARDRFLRIIQNRINFVMEHLFSGLTLYAIWTHYLNHRREHMPNNRIFLRNTWIFRQLSGRVANQANIPLNSIHRLYRILRWLTLRIRNFR